MHLFTNLSSTELLLDSVGINLVINSHVDKFVFLSSLSNQSVPVAYLEPPEIDRKLVEAYSVVPERYDIIASNNQQRVISNSALLPWRGIEATNKVFTNSNGAQEPLWYKHKLPIGVSDVEVETRSWGEVPVFEGLVIEEDIYTNYYNYYDRVTGAWAVHFVRYMLDGEQVIELLQPVSAVSEATWEDIDPDTGLYRESALVYQVTEFPTGWFYEFNLPGRYQVRPVASAVVALDTKFTRDFSAPWYPVINFGTFSANGNRWNVTDVFGLPFAPVFPYLQAFNRRLEHVSRNILIADKQGLKLKPQENYHARIYEYEQDQLVGVYVTDPALVGTKINGKVAQAGIIAADASGFIYLDFKAEPVREYYADFFYEVQEYEIPINLNPVINLRIRDHSYFVYMLPNTVAGERAVHWLEINKDGIVVEVTENALKIQVAGVYNVNTWIGKHVSELEFFPDNQRLFVGQVGINFRPSDIDAHDLRRHPEVIGDWAAWVPAMYTELGYGENGEALPGAGAVVARIDPRILIRYGGTMTEPQVRERLEAHLDANAVLVIRWDYPEFDISFTTNDGDVEIALSGDGGNYKIEYRLDPGDDWEVFDTLIDPDGVYVHELTTGDMVYYRIRVDEFPAHYYQLEVG